MKHFVLIFITFFASHNLYSNEWFAGTPFVVNYPRSTYEAGSQTWDIKQGYNGMMYFANNNGLLEFNGSKWNTYGLPNNSNVRSITTGVNDVLYTGGYNEMGYFTIGASGGAEFTSLTELVPEDYINFGDVWNIYVHPDGVIFQTYNQLMIYKNNEITVVEAPSVFHFSYMVNGEYYVVDMEKGLLRYAMGELYPLKGMEELIGTEIWGILPSNNKLLICTAVDGLFLYNGNSLEAVNNNTSDFLKKNQLYSSLRLDNGNIVFGTIQNGILICDNDLNPISHLNMSDGLQNNTILCIGLDYLGNIWLGTDHGIDYVEINSPLSHISYNYGLSSGYAAHIMAGSIYLGTNQGLFTQIQSEHVSLDNPKKMNLIENTKGQVWALEEINGTLFCGHHNGAFLIEDDEAIKISDIPGAWTFKSVPGFPDKIIEGSYTGLVYYQKENGNWSNGKQLRGFSESARSIEFDEQGTLWITHGYQGVYRIYFNSTYDSILEVDYFNSINSNLPEQVTGLTKIDGKILFLSTIGVLEYLPATNDFFIDNSYNSIFENPVQAIKLDKEKNIWYFAQNNVGVLRHGEDGKYVDISIPFKKLASKFIYSFELVYTYDKNNVFFGTENGFVHYNPRFNKNYTYDFSTYLLSMKTSLVDSLYYTADNSMDNIVLDFENNSVEFAFSANDFENPDNIVYSTFLDGNDKDWSDWQKRNSRNYTNLYEGDYTFSVKAKNIYGTITDISSFSFKVRPPFIRSFLAYVLYFVLAILILLLILYAMRRRFLKAKIKDEEKQKELFRKKEEQLQREGLEAEKEIIRMRNDSLREGIKLKDKELANSTMQMLHKNELLITLRDELKKLAELSGDDSHKHDVIRLVRGINKEIDNEKQWSVFETHFENVHEEFLKRIKATYPNLTPRELKLCAYLRMNISSKEISVLMNISTRGVEISRYRLRKKLGITRETNLTDFILTF